MSYQAHEEFNCKKILGIDVEKEDREVGIFGNTFLMGIETEEKKNLCLIFGDDGFLELINCLKPYVLSQIQEEEMEREIYAEFERGNYEREK